jgi:nucleotide-binding universal stress UspA family protein
MKKILVPCDFSKPAVHAFRFAMDVAARSKGLVHLIHVIEVPILHDSLIVPILTFEKGLFKELREKVDAQFAQLIKKYRTEGIKVTWSVDFGAPSKLILDYIYAKSIDLVVIGSHGATGLRACFIGSNTEKIIRKSPVPVLILKKFYTGAINHIVFPNRLDTLDQEDLVMKVKALQDFFKAHLYVVWINTPLNFTSDVITSERLHAFAKRYMLKNYSVHIFNHPVEEDGIIQFTKLVKGNMIAMGTHGRLGIAHLINGSLAEDVANHTENLMWTSKLFDDTSIAVQQ